MRFAQANFKRARAPFPMRKRQSAFTLAEVLAAMLFMAIVIPVAVEAYRVASLAGEVSVRKSEATRVADRVLNETIVMTNWLQSALSGTVIENGLEYRWNIKNENWPVDSVMRLLIAEVEFNAGGRPYNVRLNTLANAPGLGGMALP
ncbi:MAG TPA: type II secretion system protein [Verrucomicrobiae bacterium]|nr:type II secretion system protein [Verrucomicrobiae bacterium]